MGVKDFFEKFNKKEKSNYPDGNIEEKIKEIKEDASDIFSAKMKAGEAVLIRNYKDYIKLTNELKHIQTNGFENLSDLSIYAQRVVVGKPVYFSGMVECKDQKNELASLIITNYEDKNGNMNFCALSNSEFKKDNIDPFIIPLSEEDDKTDSPLGAVDTLVFSKLNQVNLPDLEP